MFKMDVILKKILYINIILSIFNPLNSLCQEKKIIEIIEAGRFTKDEENFPKANILSKGNNSRVNFFMMGNNNFRQNFFTLKRINSMQTVKFI